MTSTYKRLDQINPDLFRSLILGSDDSQPEQGQAGIMAPRPRPEGLGVRDIDTTPALEETLLAEVARGMGENAIDRERVANAVVPAMPVDPTAEMENPWFSLVPIADFLTRDKTEEAIPTLASSRNATPPLQMPLTGVDFTAGAEPVTETSSVGALLDLIGSGEGTYNSYNSGTVDDVIQHSSSSYRYNDTPLSEMTIGQIRERMAITDATNPDRIFAAGRYQVIPETFESAVESLGLSDDTVFNRETQDRIGMYLVSDKRPRLNRYIEGGDVSVEAAMTDLALEFASFPSPIDVRQGRYGEWPKRDIVAGESIYVDPEGAAGSNRASHTIEETRAILERVRGSTPQQPSLAPTSSLVPRPRPQELQQAVAEQLPTDIAETVQQADVETPADINRAIFDGASFSGELATPSRGEDPIAWIADNAYGISEENPDFRRAMRGLVSGIDPETTPWCAAFAGHVLRNVGAELPEAAQQNPNLAFNYQDIGEEVYNYNPRTNTTYAGSLDEVQAGDVIVFNKNADRQPDGSFGWGQGHISFIVDVEDDGTIIAVGGNQGDRVQTSRYTPSSIARNYPGGFRVRRITNTSLEQTSPEVISAITRDIAAGGAGL
jgi:hypothetical protein